MSKLSRVDLCCELHQPLSSNRRLQRIRFHSGSHRYFVLEDSGRVRSNFVSVTSLIARVFPKFDANSNALRIVESRRFRQRHKRYEKYFKQHGPSILEDPVPVAAARLAEGWKEEGRKAAELGTAMHLDCENFYNDRPVLHPASAEHRMFLEYAQHMSNLGYEPFATELMVYGNGVSGAIDMLYKHSLTGAVVLRDWKRTKKLSSFGFGARSPFSVFAHLQAGNFVKYSLQLNLYAAILRKWYNIDVQDMAVVVLHPNNSTFIEKRVQRMDTETAELFRFRSHLRKTQRAFQGFVSLACLLPAAAARF